MAVERNFKSYAEKIAIDFRKKMGLQSFDFLSAFSLCSYLNIPLIEPAAVLGLEQHHLRNLLDFGSNNWSAATIPLGGGLNIIVHNTTHSEVRQQSNLMHELAHIICEHETPETYALYNLPAILRNYDNDQESEAEILGSCLQLPRPALIWALKNKFSIEQICSHYVASPAMVQYRLNITGAKHQIK